MQKSKHTQDYLQFQNDFNRILTKKTNKKCVLLGDRVQIILFSLVHFFPLL